MIRDMKSRSQGNRPVRRLCDSVRSTARAYLNPFRGIPPILERFGVPIEPVLQTARIHRADFDDPERSAPFADLDQLLGVCIRKTKCDHFGLLLGEYVNLQSFGVAGRLARYAPSVGAALKDLASFFVLHDNGGSISVSIHEGSVTLSYGIHVPGVRHADQVYDLAVSAMTNVMRQLRGSGWKPDAVLLPRTRPRDIRRYREHFAAPLRFNSVLAAIMFPESDLLQPIADADPLLHSLLADNASAAIAQQNPLLHGDVRRTIRGLLPTGQCSRSEVARRLGLHERTLGRRLQSGRVTFQQLLDDTREEMARQLLRDTHVPIARIAAALGYGDATVFTRAFTRWTDRTPSEFRAHMSAPHSVSS